MMLTGFGAAVARVEAERLTNARAAIAAGWTPEDHPHACCPTEPPAPRQEVPASDYAARRAVSMNAKAERLRGEVAKLEGEISRHYRRPDRAEANIPFSKRSRPIDADVNLAVAYHQAKESLDYAQSRAMYWARKAEAA